MHSIRANWISVAFYDLYCRRLSAGGGGIRSSGLPSALERGCLGEYEDADEMIYGCCSLTYVTVVQYVFRTTQLTSRSIEMVDPLEV